MTDKLLGYVNVYEDEDGEVELGSTDLDDDIDNPMSGCAAKYIKYLGRGAVILVKPNEDLEPTEAEQGLIPIPDGYAEN